MSTEETIDLTCNIPQQQQQQQEQQQQQLQQNVENRSNDNNYNTNNNISFCEVREKNELTHVPILEIPDVVLFPGETITISFTNQSWIRYIQRQQKLEPKIKIAIITERKVLERQEQRRREHLLDRQEWLMDRLVIGRNDDVSSFNRRRMTFQRILRITELNYLNSNSNSNNNQSDESSSSSSSSSSSTNLSSSSVSVSEQHHNHNRQNDTTTISDSNSRQTQRHILKHPLLGRIGTMALITSTQHRDPDENNYQQQQQELFTINNDDELLVKAVGIGRFRAISAIGDHRYSQSYLESSSIGIFQVEELTCDHESLALPPLLQQQQRLFANTSYNSSAIANTTGSNNKKGTGHNINNDSGIRKKKKIEIETETNFDNINMDDNHNDDVEEKVKNQSTKFNNDSRTNSKSEAEIVYPLLLNYHSRMLKKLSIITPTPYIAFGNKWPWKLVARIRQILERSDIFEGLRSNLPSSVSTAIHNNNVNATTVGSTNNNDSNNQNKSDGIANFISSSSSVLDPLPFSFWMSANMSLKQEQKLKLLNMISCVERLRYILRKLQQQEEEISAISCSLCSEKLSQVNSIFTFGNTDGTTGNHLNPHGIVHQITTVRNLHPEATIYYSGNAETYNSYFPGYSWRNFGCSTCGNHLGWKFELAEEEAIHNNNGRRQNHCCPKKFFSLLTSSVSVGDT